MAVYILTRPTVESKGTREICDSKFRRIRVKKIPPNSKNGGIFVQSLFISVLLFLLKYF